MARVFLAIAGILIGLLGIWWILQGTNIVHVGFMAGHLQYAILGLIAVILGLSLILLSSRRRTETRSSVGPHQAR